MRVELYAEGYRGMKGRYGEMKKIQKMKWRKEEDNYNETKMMKGRKATNDHRVRF